MKHANGMMGLMAAGLVALLATGAGAQERRTGIVFINMDRAFNEFYKTKLADAQLKAQAKEFDEERKKMVGGLDGLQKEFTSVREEAQNTALSEEVRAAKRNLAEEKLMTIREQEGKIKRFEELRSKQLEDQSRRMRRSIVDEIREIVKSHAREKGYDAVLDSSGSSLNGVELALYVDVKVDITDEVLKLVNKGEKK